MKHFTETCYATRSSHHICFYRSGCIHFYVVVCLSFHSMLSYSACTSSVSNTEFFVWCAMSCWGLKQLDHVLPYIYICCLTICVYSILPYIYIGCLTICVYAVLPYMYILYMIGIYYICNTETWNKFIFSIYVVDAQYRVLFNYALLV